jgi:hypothetical protein
LDEISHKKENIKKAVFHFVSFWPLVLSHHPDCERFKGHTLNIGKIRLCIGCFVGYPTAIISILLISFFNLSSIIPYQLFLPIGLGLLSTFFLSIINLTKIKVVKIIQKFLIGVGASFLFWWIWYGDTPLNVRFYTFSYTFTIILGILNFYHVYGFFTTCYKCDTPFAWGSCPGFNFLRIFEDKHDLRNLFEGMDSYTKKILRKREEKKIISF